MSQNDLFMYTAGALCGAAVFLGLEVMSLDGAMPVQGVWRSAVQNGYAPAVVKLPSMERCGNFATKKIEARFNDEVECVDVRAGKGMRYFMDETQKIQAEAYNF